MVLVPPNRDYFSFLIYVVDKNEGPNMYTAHVLHGTLQRLELLRIFQNLIHLL